MQDAIYKMQEGYTLRDARGMFWLAACISLLATFFIFLLISDSSAKARKAHAAIKGGAVKVTSIRHYTYPNYTRIVIDLSNDTKFSHRLLKEDPSINKPRRLYVDIQKATISPSLKQPISIHDGLLKMARAGQYSKDTVRVVLDIESIEDYKVFPLAEPFRIVIDVTGKSKIEEKAGDEHPSLPGEVLSSSPPLSTPPTLAQQLGLKIGKIVVDAGHGGKDPGAIGKNGLREKNVVLKIAKGLKESLIRETGAEVIMTRDSDTFISLEERTAIANAKEADIFISIHVNASFSRRANGVETYFLNLTNDAQAIRVAARENAVSTKKMSDLQYILNDLMKTAKTNESSRFAQTVQDHLVSTLRSKYSDVKGNGVKGAPFYVLVGTHMPSILVEVSFISNPKEEQRLSEDAYIQEIINGITAGVREYVKGMEVAHE